MALHQESKHPLASSHIQRPAPTEELNIGKFQVRLRRNMSQLLRIVGCRSVTRRASSSCDGEVFERGDNLADGVTGTNVTSSSVAQ
jgi:hypothetical protein